jgi:hypothetical protein
MPHTELACDGGGSGVVPGVDSTLGGLGMEAEGCGEGSKGGKCSHTTDIAISQKELLQTHSRNTYPGFIPHISHLFLFHTIPSFPSEIFGTFAALTRGLSGIASFRTFQRAQKHSNLACVAFYS